MKSQAISEKIRSSRILIENAITNEDIQKYLKKVGFPPANLQKGKALLEEVVMLQQLQKDHYGLKYNATDTVQADFQALREQYGVHLNIAKAAFHKNRGIHTSLGINRPQPKNRAGWSEQLFRFYSKALELHETLATYGLSKSEIEQSLAMAEAYMQGQIEQEDKKGDAQRATRQRDLAMKKLERWVRGFKAIVKVAVEEDEQLLEKLGMVVTP